MGSGQAQNVYDSRIAEVERLEQRLVVVGGASRRVEQFKRLVSDNKVKIQFGFGVTCTHSVACD
nr:unnamed protein product [Callosobruchus analis]